MTGRPLSGDAGRLLAETIFPLSAIVGCEALVEALLVNAVAPEVGGVLVRGERGTAKSTAVRALAPLLPPVAAADGAPFAFAPGDVAPDGPVAGDAPVRERPAPLVELPLGATLDRLVGALDLGRALAGERAFEPGLLARAHRGILYVDEVNLLADHLVDALLDAAASGVARVERDAVSVAHDARFILVGTMNVEEGELRPQLLDRFGLGVDVRGPADPAARAQIVRRRLAFERDPAAFCAGWADAERALAARIAAARCAVGDVRLGERELLRITGACARLGVDGVRGDIVAARAARVLAALDGCDEVTEEHVRRAAALALPHRRRRDPLDGGAEADADALERAFDDGDGEPDPPSPNGSRGRDRGERAPTPDRVPAARAHDGAGASAPDRVPAACAPDDAGAHASSQDGGTSAHASSAGGKHDPEAPPADERGAPAARRGDPPAPARLPLDALSLDGTGRGPHGRRARAAGPQAGAIDSRPAAAGATDLAIVATLRARLVAGGAAPAVIGLPAPPVASPARLSSCAPADAPAPSVAPGARLCEDAPGRRVVFARLAAAAAPLREHMRAGREGVLLCLVVDASGSMAARRRLARVKGALLAVLRDAYARRDRVAIVAFRGDGAELLVQPGAPLERAAAAARALPAGGRTPLAAGLLAAEQVLRREALREPDRRAIAIVLTDGRVADPGGAARAAAGGLARAAAAVHVVDTEDGPVRLGLAAELAAAAGARLHRLHPAPQRRAA